jgi:hypothetical protein
MPDDSNIIPPVRLVRWAAIVLIISFAAALYFRYGTRLPTISATAPSGASADSAP